jgi:hypothetical protein
VRGGGLADSRPAELAETAKFRVGREGGREGQDCWLGGIWLKGHPTDGMAVAMLKWKKIFGRFFDSSCKFNKNSLSKFKYILGEPKLTMLSFSQCSVLDNSQFGTFLS